MDCLSNSYVQLDRVEDQPGVFEFWRDSYSEFPASLAYGLNQRFVIIIYLENENVLSSIKEQPCLILANHQVGIESVLLVSLLPSRIGTRVNAIGKNSRS